MAYGRSSWEVLVSADADADEGFVADPGSGDDPYEPQDAPEATESDEDED